MDDFASELGIDFNTSSLKNVEADSLRAAKAMEDVESAATGMEGALNSANKAAGDTAGKVSALDSVLDGLRGSAGGADDALKALGNDTEAVARKQTAFLASLKAQADTLGMAKSDILAYKAAQLGVGDQAAGSIAKLKAFEQGMSDLTVKTKLTHHEMMNLSVQVKDFSESIISGQNPLRAFVQQMLTANTIVGQAGVSWKNVLSQVGSGIGSLVTRFGGLILAGTAVAAAIGGVVFALTEMHKGAEESIKVVNSLNATGRAAGITSADFYSMADSIHEATGKSAQEVRALELQVVQSGKVMGENVGLLTETAINLSKAMGTDAKKSMESLLPLFGDSTKAAAALNEQYHFLTGALYEEIKALQESGDAQGAAKLAMDALNAQTGKQVENLGILEQSWKGLKDMIGEATNALMNWGKVKMPADRSADASKVLGDQIAALENQKAQTARGNIGGRGAFTEADDARLKVLKDQKTLLDAQISSIKQINDDEAKRKDQVAKIAGYLSSGPSGQLTALKQQRAELKAIIDAGGEGFNLKDLQAQLKYVDNQIASVGKKYDGWHKAAKVAIPEMTRDLERYAAAALKAVSAFNEAGQRAAIESAQATTKSLDKNYAMSTGNDQQLRYLEAQAEVLSKNKEAFDQIALQQKAGVILTDEQVKKQEDLLDRLTREELQRRANEAAAKAEYAATTAQKEYGQLKNSMAIGGYESYDQMKLVIELRKQDKDLTLAAAQEEARRLINLKRETDELEKQVERKRSLSAKTAGDNAESALVAASDAFWNTFLIDGAKAGRDFGDQFTDILRDATATGLKDGFDPILDYFRKELNAAMKKLSGDISGTIQGLLSKVGILKKDPETGQYSFDDTTTAGKLVKRGAEVYAGYQTGQSILQATGLNGKTNAQQLNSSIGSALGAAIGSFIPGIGTAIGSVIGGFLGGLIGPKSADNRAQATLTSTGALSGSITGKPTDETSGALSDAIGAISSGYEALKSLGGTITTYVKDLHIGNRDTSEATLSNGTKINAGTVGDSADLANDALMAVLKTTDFASSSLNKIRDAMVAAGQSFDDTTAAISSVKGVLDAVGPQLSDWRKNLKQIDDVFKPLIATTGEYSAALEEAYAAAKAGLKTAFDKDIASQFVQLTSDAGNQITSVIEQIVTRWGDLNAIGGDSALVGKLDQAQIQSLGTALGSAIAKGSASVGDLNLALAQLQKEASDLGSSSADVAGLFSIIKKTIASNFNAEIDKELLAIKSPLASQYQDMLDNQAKRLSDAAAVGGSLNKVLELNAAETQKFVDGLSNSYTSISDLTQAYTELKKQMSAAGQSTASLDSAYEGAKTTMRTGFDQSTADSLLQASNETLYNLEQMLQTQKQRIADATALGANLAAVDRLNAVETSNFFKNLSETEKLQLGDYLGLIEDYTGKIGVVGTKLLDALDPLVTGLDDQINALKETSANLRNLAKSIGDTSQSIKDQYSNVTPIAALSNLRDEFKNTAASAIGGDQDAMSKLSDLANNLIARSRNANGSTAAFGADVDLVTSLLDQAKAAASTGADAADTQIEALNSQIDLLTEIKNILNDPDPQLATLAADTEALLPAFGDVKTLLSQYLALQASQAGQTLSESQLAVIATLVSSAVANTQATTQAVNYANATTGQTAQTTNTASPSTTGQAANDTATAQLAGYFQALQKQLSESQAQNASLAQQNLNLQRQIAANTAKITG